MKPHVSHVFILIISAHSSDFPHQPEYFSPRSQTQTEILSNRAEIAANPLRRGPKQTLHAALSFKVLLGRATLIFAACRYLPRPLAQKESNRRQEEAPQEEEEV